MLSKRRKFKSPEVEEYMLGKLLKEWAAEQNDQKLAETSEGKKRWVQIEIKQRNEDSGRGKTKSIFITII